MKIIISIIFLLSLTLFNFAYSSEYNAIVSKVTDGDSIHVIYKGNKLKIRLLYIDAPELKQAYGMESKEFLENIILNKTVTVSCAKKDFYGRELCEIFLYGSDTPTYINAKMIKSGNAWVYKSNRSNTYLINLEKDAIYYKRGLWHSEDAIEPWAYRILKK